MENGCKSANVSIITVSSEKEYEKEINGLKEISQFSASHVSKYMLKSIKELNTKLGHIENQDTFCSI